MQTRSAARKSAALAQASPAAPKPLMTDSKEEAPKQEWDPGRGEEELESMEMEGITVPLPARPPRFNPIPVERSLDSLFYGSLSSISSSSSSSGGGGSFSSVDDDDDHHAPAPSSSPRGSFSFTPSTDAAAAAHASFVAVAHGQYTSAETAPMTPHNHSRTGPTRVARGTSKRRLAKRPYPVAGALTSSSNSSSSSSSSSMPARSPNRAPPRRDATVHWNSDPVCGGAPPSPSPSKAGVGRPPRARTASASELDADADDIFQRELQLLLRSKELALAGVKAVLRSSKPTSTHGRGKAKQHPFPFPPPHSYPHPHPHPQSSPIRTQKPPSARRPLGPEGTELIDESFRAAPAGPSVYPQDWVAHPSNTLHAHPTLPIIDDAKPPDAMVH